MCREDTRGYNPKPPENKHSISGAMPRKKRKCPTTTEAGNQETMKSCTPSGGHFYWGTPRCNTQIISHWARKAHRKAMMHLPSTPQSSHLSSSFQFPILFSTFETRSVYRICILHRLFILILLLVQLNARQKHLLLYF